MELDETTRATRNLFGRSMVYVLIWSLGLGAGIVVTPIITRTLGVVGFGRLVAAQTVGQVFVAIAGLGMQAAIIRQRVDDEDDRHARGLLFVALTAALLLTGVVDLTGPAWCRLFGFDAYGGVVRLMVLWVAPAAAAQAAMGLLRAQDRLRAFALVSLLQSVGAQAVAVAMLFIVHRTAETYALGLLLSQLFALGVGLLLTSPRPGGLRDIEVIRAALAIGLPLVPQGVAVFVLSAGDRLVIQRLLGPSAVGRYQVSYSVGSVLLLVMASLNQSWEAVVLAVADADRRAAVIADARNRLLRVVMPLTVGIGFASSIVLRVWAPPAFHPEQLLMVTAVVSISAFPYAFYLSNVLRLLSVRRTSSLAVASVICAVLNIALNFALIPSLGIAGSALATALALSAQAALTGRAAARFLPLRATAARALGLALVGAVLTLLTVAVPTSPLWIGPRVVGCVLCACLAGLALTTQPRGTGARRSGALTFVVRKATS